MKRIDRIRSVLEGALVPERLEIEDESHRHAGHAGAAPGGETHYSLVVVSAKFLGESRVARQRRVYALLAEEFEGGLHALSVTALAPGETSGARANR